MSPPATGTTAGTGAGAELTRRVLHGVRLLGFADSGAIADRCELADEIVGEELLDQQAHGRTARSEFAGQAGWSLTTEGRQENERLLADQLDTVPDGRSRLDRVHADFLPMNERLQRTCTDWQLRPTPADPLAFNDHRDTGWDADVLARLEDLAQQLVPLERALIEVLPRFAGYQSRFVAALRHRRIDETTDSCHRVWFELHEDLIATLGLERA